VVQCLALTRKLVILIKDQLYIPKGKLHFGEQQVGALYYDYYYILLQLKHVGV
jgi:hypothetical protein